MSGNIRNFVMGQMRQIPPSAGTMASTAVAACLPTEQHWMLRTCGQRDDAAHQRVLRGAVRAERILTGGERHHALLAAGGGVVHLQVSYGGGSTTGSM